MLPKSVRNALDRLHPQHVCSILAVSYGVKPSAIVESVEVRCWLEFLRLTRLLGLCLAYRAAGGLVVITERGDAMYFRDVSLLCAPEDCDLPEVSTLSLSDALSLKPESDEGVDYHDIYVARELGVLLVLARLHVARTFGKGSPDRELGRVLGYPVCCVDNYVALGPVRAWHEYQRKLIVSGLDQSMPVELWAVYHAPCSPKCRETLRLGAECLEAVERFSKELRCRVESRLSCAHLAFSIGRRFIDFLESRTASVRPEVREKASEFLQEPVYVTVGHVLRPFSFFVWEEGNFRLRLTPEVMGRKYLAYSPGNGVLIMGENLETYVYMSKRALGRNYAAYASTAFRVYRCSNPRA